MPSVHNPESLCDVREVPFAEVATGQIVWYDGFWGVIVRGVGGFSSFNGRGVDRWGAPPAAVEPQEIVLVPYRRRLKPPLRKAISVLGHIRPMQSSISRS